MLFQMNICDRKSSPGFKAKTFPSTTAIAPRVAADTKSPWTLNRARSRRSLWGRLLFGSSLLDCNSSFQSRVWPGICSSYPSLNDDASSARIASNVCSIVGASHEYTWYGVRTRSRSSREQRNFWMSAKFFLEMRIRYGVVRFAVILRNSSSD